jgi:hypothetical protein
MRALVRKQFVEITIPSIQSPRFFAAKWKSTMRLLREKSNNMLNPVGMIYVERSPAISFGDICFVRSKQGNLFIMLSRKKYLIIGLREEFLYRMR